MQSKNKPSMTVLERAFVALVKALPCSVCDTAGPSEAHEIKQGQWWTSIALCIGCHRGPKNGLHGERRMWALKKMEPIDALAVTIRRVFEKLLGKRS